MQADEVRYKEDMPALGLNWIRLGLDDVLYDPKTKTIYTPNTNASVKVGEGGIAVGDEKERYNPFRDEKVRFASGGGGKSSGKSRRKGLTKKNAYAKMGYKETKLITSEINTYHSKRYEGKKICYYSGKYSRLYEFKIMVMVIMSSLR
ncbi:hypothetical protein [Ruminococcus albus]|uniref:Uncharacterized protein n=1 Tax=Ruminococcus albus TaxID=1264 RepID=A0A1I1QYC1_RUMAL|nr:hypothetical protein [Ruminococcus albus]SFD27045.1 hypothetical protein SAMN02910406_03545 [Ruminococcus albus]